MVDLMNGTGERGGEISDVRKKKVNGRPDKGVNEHIPIRRVPTVY